MISEIEKKLEEMVLDNLDEAKLYEFGTRERESAIKEADDLLNHLHKIDEDRDNYWDKKEKREIEQEKSKTTWFKAGLEVAKVVMPVAAPIIAYNVFQKRVIKFEETGRLVSFAARDLHLPKFFK